MGLARLGNVEPDLTDPNALSVPIAVLGLGQNLNDQGSWCAGVVGVDAMRIGIDPLRRPCSPTFLTWVTDARTGA